jgi:hypothetical protein
LIYGTRPEQENGRNSSLSLLSIHFLVTLKWFNISSFSRPFSLSCSKKKQLKALGNKAVQKIKTENC